MIEGKKLVIAAALLAAVQIGFLSWVIAGRAAILRDGKEVLLQIEPVDPRDYLRGDYLTITYEIRNVPVKLIGNAPQGEFTTENGSIFVRLGRDPDGYWRARSASFSKPSKSPTTAGEVDLRGSVGGGSLLGPDASVYVDYGIDRFYVPEGQGLSIQEDMRTHPFGVLVAVANDGTPQVKALMDGDQKLSEEPLY